MAVSNDTIIEIVDAMLKTLMDRKGLDAAWDECDDDTQEEIREDLRDIVRRILNFR